MDISQLKELIEHNFPKHFDGKTAIEILKENDFNWKQMEWAGFYTEYIMGKLMTNTCPEKAWGNTYNNTTFDAEINGIDVDFKTHSINKPNGKRSTPWVICNDWYATNESIKKNGKMYLIIPNIDFVYDEDGSFKVWHDNLKGEQSKYCKEKRRSSRKRKVSGNVVSVDIFEVTAEALIDKTLCKEIKQGRNSNGKPRPTKMSFNTSNNRPLFSIELS